MQLYRTAASALSVNRDLVRIASERIDIAFHPFKSLYLVLESCVEVTVGRILELGHGQEPEGVKTVVNGDDNHVGTLVNPVVKGPISRVTIDVA